MHDKFIYGMMHNIEFKKNVFDCWRNHNEYEKHMVVGNNDGLFVYNFSPPIVGE